MKNNYKKTKHNLVNTLGINWVVILFVCASVFFTKNAFGQPPPPAPVATSATNFTCTSFNANWNPVPGAIFYLMDISTDVNFSTFVSGYQDFNVGNSTTFNVSGLFASDYYYRVRSFDGTNPSLNSNVIFVSELLGSAPVAQSPTNITCTSFNASWSVSVGAIGYYLDVSTDAGFSSFVASYNNLNVGNVTTYNVAGLSLNTTYHYRLRSDNGCVISANSNVIAVLTGSPSAPVATAASNFTCTSANANWGAAVGATTYYLDVSSDPTFGLGNFLSGYENLNIGNVTTYNVTGLQTGVTYYYRVRAANACTTSSNSNSISLALSSAATLSSTLTPAPICSGSAFNYTPTSSTSGTTFAWTRAAVAGISNLAASGTGNPNETLTNSTSVALNVTYVYTLTSNGCTNSTTYSIVVTVNSSPTLSSSLSPPAVCGGSTFNYTPTSATSGTTFTWTRAMVAGISNAAANGTDDPNEVLVNTTTSPVNVTYVYSLSANGCTNSTTNSVVVTVNPFPTLSSSLSPPAVCGGGTFSYTPTSSTSGTTFSWTRAMVSGISNTAGSGVGNPNEILVNTTTSPVNVTYVYTLTANGCTNPTTYSVVVTVNPSPTLSSTITPAAVCGASTFSYTPTSSTSGTTFAWTRAVVSGISNNAGSGTAGISEALINTTSSAVNVTYVYTLTANGCTNSTTYSVVVAVNSSPTLNSSLSPPAVCGGSTFNYTPTSATSGTTFSWTRAMVAGISNAAANGTDDPNEVLVNTTTSPVNVTYIYSLSANGCTNSTTNSVVVAVNPLPTVTTSSTGTVCSGATSNISLTATVASNFSWTLGTNTGSITGATASSGSSIIQTLVNPSTSAAGTIEYIVTPISTTGSCLGSAYTITIVVNPSPTLSSTLTPAAVCGASTFSYTPTSSTSGTTFAWTRAVVSGISNNAGSGTAGISEALINTTSSAVNVTYVYTLTANGCTNSTTYSVVVTVNPGSNITLSSSLTPPDMYSGSVFNYIPTSFTPGTTFAWTRPTVVGISNATASGTDNPNEMLVNTTNTAVIVEYLYTLTANGCSNSSPDTVRFKVLPIVVWPGDANNDMVVNNFDLLPLGVHFSQTGTPRASTANLWQAYMATNWGTNQNNGQDLMHVDCDGNGTIDNDDTLAINQNFSLTHLVATPPVEIYSNERTTPDMYFVINSSAFNAGDWVPVELWLGSTSAPLTNIYGLAFNIQYDQSLVENATESLTYATNWLGTPGTDMLTISKIDAMANTAYGAMVRNDQTSRSGYGKVADFKFQVSNTLTADDTIKFSISSYMVIDSTGTAQTLTVGTDTVWVSPLSTGIVNRKVENTVSIAPNPFSTNTTITFNTEVQNATVKVFDVVGKEVKVVNFSGKEFTLEKGDLNAGIYSVKIIATNQSVIANQKIVIR